MNEKERIEFNKMKQELEALRRCTDIVFVENIKNRGIGSIDVEDGASSTGTAQSVRNSTNTGTETVADTYNGVLTLTDKNGDTYRIGYYS